MNTYATGQFVAWRNGAEGSPGKFTRVEDIDSPFFGCSFPVNAAAAFADVDGDGDDDMISVSHLNNALTVSENVSSRGITMSLRVTAQNDLPDTTGPLTVTPSVSAGRLETPGGIGGLTLTGTMAAIDLMLNTAGVLTYTSAPNDTAPVTLTFAADDGTGPTSLGRVMPDITAVNDLPQGILPQWVFATEDLISGLDLSGLSLSDPDAAAGLSLTLAVAAGSLQALGRAGVTGAGSGSAVLTLTGGAAALNAWLLQPGAVSYLGLAEANGLVAMTVTADDGTGALILGQVDMVVAPVDDAPVIHGLPAFVSATEDRAAALDLSALTVSDLDSAGPIRVVVSTSAGSLVGLDGAGVVVTGSGSAALTLTGMAAEIDPWLNAPGAVTHAGAANGFGTVLLTLTAQDDTSQRTAGTITVKIAEVADTQIGGALADVLTGDGGRDLLLGGAGNDTQIGSAGADTQEGVIYDNATGRLSFDVDGLGGVDPVVFAQLQSGLAPEAASFLIS